MVTAIEPILRTQLLNRRHKLEAAVAFSAPVEVSRLLEEVDAALQRMDEGVYGICEVCHEPVEEEVLLVNPASRICLGDLTPKERQALEDDLHLAAQIQRGLLPQRKQDLRGWDVAYHYQPAGVVSGDYCDFIDGDRESIHFVLGDVSGKGVAASMLMAHLHAMFRTLVSIKLPLGKIVEQASRVFSESTLPTQYATLVCGHADGNGVVEICNAGHPPPLLVHRSGVRQLEATGMPVGIFDSESFQVTEVQMERGDLLFLYTDGLSETTNVEGNEYGVERLTKLIEESRELSPSDLIDRCRMELHSFGGKHLADDLTLMVVRRSI